MTRFAIHLGDKHEVADARANRTAATMLCGISFVPDLKSDMSKPVCKNCKRTKKYKTRGRVVFSYTFTPGKTYTWGGKGKTKGADE